MVFLFSKNSFSLRTFYVLSTSPRLVQFLNSTIPWEHKICTIRGPPVFLLYRKCFDPLFAADCSRQGLSSIASKTTRFFFLTWKIVQLRTIKRVISFRAKDFTSKLYYLLIPSLDKELLDEKYDLLHLERKQGGFYSHAKTIFKLCTY